MVAGTAGSAEEGDDEENDEDEDADELGEPMRLLHAQIVLEFLEIGGDQLVTVRAFVHEFENIAAAIGAAHGDGFQFLVALFEQTHWADLPTGDFDCIVAEVGGCVNEGREFIWTGRRENAGQNDLPGGKRDGT